MSKNCLFFPENKSKRIIINILFELSPLVAESVCDVWLIRTQHLQFLEEPYQWCQKFNLVLSGNHTIRGQFVL